MKHNIWLIVGFVGQAVFASRFIVQWIVSEKHKRSIIPDIFWYLSLLGSTILFSYALHMRDPVFIVGQGLGLFIYLRNIYFISRKDEPATQAK